jgi:hypothetical protein
MSIQTKDYLKTITQTGCAITQTLMTDIIDTFATETTVSAISTNSTFDNITLSNNVSTVIIEPSTLTLTGVVTATNNFLLITVNGDNKAIQLWNY